MRNSNATSERSSNGKNYFSVSFCLLFTLNFRYLMRIRRKICFLRGLCIRLICFYQNKLSRHTCLYTPSCSEYTKRCISNFGVIVGILLGMWIILRCNPLSMGGIDPAPERPFLKRWLL